MAYVPLQNVDLGLDYAAKDISIIQYNKSLKKLEVFVNQMNTNVEWLGYTKETIGDTLPAEADDNDEFVLLE